MMNNIIAIAILIVLGVNLVMLTSMMVMIYKVNEGLKNLKNGITIGTLVDFGKKNYKRIIKQIKKIKIFN